MAEGSQPPILSKLCLPYLFQIVQRPLPSTSTAIFVAFFYWLIRWSYQIWYFILLNDFMDLHVLCQKDISVCFMQQGINFTEVWYVILLFTSKVFPTAGDGGSPPTSQKFAHSTLHLEKFHPSRLPSHQRLIPQPQIITQ